MASILTSSLCFLSLCAKCFNLSEPLHGYSQSAGAIKKYFMWNVLLSLLISFAITYFTIPAIIYLARHRRIYDVPDERKIHAFPVPALGGLGIFGGLVLTVLLFVPFGRATEFQYFMAAILITFFIG